MSFRFAIRCGLLVLLALTLPLANRVERRLPKIEQVSVQFVGVDERKEPTFIDLFWSVDE